MQNGLRSAILGGAGAGLGNSVSLLGRYLGKIAANKAWNNASFPQKLIATSNAITSYARNTWSVLGTTAGNLISNVVSNLNQ